MAQFLSPLKGSSKNPEHYPHRIEISKISGMDIMDFNINHDMLEGINECEGDVGTYFKVSFGDIVYQLAFSNPNDAMLFKLRFHQ